MVHTYRKLTGWWRNWLIIFLEWRLEHFWKAIEIEEDIKSHTSIINIKKTIDDKTNLTHNPGAYRVAVKRGCKYLELIINISTSGWSLILSPYIVYKASKIWDPQRMNGSKGTKYSKTGLILTGLMSQLFIAGLKTSFLMQCIINLVKRSWQETT